MKKLIMNKYSDVVLEAEIPDSVTISDGFHTFEDLYEHRIRLWIALCAKMHYLGERSVWRSKFHSDGTSYEGWFILGIGVLSGGQITYHLPLGVWDDTHFAQTLERAPEFDGHTPKDVLDRLMEL